MLNYTLKTKLKKSSHGIDVIAFLNKFKYTIFKCKLLENQKTSYKSNVY